MKKFFVFCLVMVVARLSSAGSFSIGFGWNDGYGSSVNIGYEHGDSRRYCEPVVICEPPSVVIYRPVVVHPRPVVICPRPVYRPPVICRPIRPVIHPVVHSRRPVVYDRRPSHRQPRREPCTGSYGNDGPRPSSHGGHNRF